MSATTWDWFCLHHFTSQAGFLTIVCIHSWLFTGDAKLFQPDGSLEEVDPEIFGIIKKEKSRQVPPCLTQLMHMPAPRLAPVVPVIHPGHLSPFPVTTVDACVPFSFHQC